MTWGVVIAAVGVGMSAMGTYQQSKARAAQAQYQSQVAMNNSIIAQQNAADVRDRGTRDEEDHRAKVAQSKGAAKGSMAANGFLIDDPGSTNVDLLADIAEAGEYDIQKIQDNTAREERRALIRAITLLPRLGFTAKAGAENPAFSAGGTLLSGAGGVHKAGQSAGYWK